MKQFSSQAERMKAENIDPLHFHKESNIDCQVPGIEILAFAHHRANTA